MSLSRPSHIPQAATTPSIFYYFQSLPSELQLMVWEEFLHGEDKNKPRVVLLGARRSNATDQGIYAGQFGFDWSWCLELDNYEQLREDPRSEVAQSLLPLCWSSRHVATRFLDVPRPSRVPLYLGRDVFWLPDDLLAYTNTIYDSSFLRVPDEPCVTFYDRDGIELSEFGATFGLLGGISCAMISLATFEQALLWAGPSYEWRGDVDIETFQKQKNCMKDLFEEFGGFPNLIVMVDASRGYVSLSKLVVVNVEDPALSKMGAKEDPDRFLEAFRNYETLVESLRRPVDAYLNADNSEGGDHLAPVTDLELPGWMSEAPKLSFAFKKPNSII